MPAKKPAPAVRRDTTRTAAPRAVAQKAARPAPTKVYKPQVVTNVKTMSNGQPRPKSRIK